MGVGKRTGDATPHLHAQLEQATQIVGCVVSDGVTFWIGEKRVQGSGEIGWLVSWDGRIWSGVADVDVKGPVHMGDVDAKSCEYRLVWPNIAGLEIEDDFLGLGERPLERFQVR